MLKKLLALLLAGLLCVGLAVPVFASGWIAGEDDPYADDDGDDEDDDEDDDGPSSAYDDYNDRLRSIHLSSSSMRMVVGEQSRQLRVRFTPSTASEGVAWSSSDEDIAYVDDNGNVEAVAKGRAIIEAESASGKVASCVVEVRDSDDRYDAVEEVEMNIKELTVRKGQTRQLIAHVSPSNLDPEDEKLSWESDDTKIATVDPDGTVTGIALGTTTITASADNGEKDTCRVTVVSASAALDDGEKSATTTTAAASSSSSSSTVVGALSSANVRSSVQRAAEATASGKTGMAAFADSGVITPELMTTAASAAGGKSVMMRFATTSLLTKKRLAYLSLDPKVGRNLESGVNTGVLVDGKEVDAAKATFDKYYRNETTALYLAQPGSFGMTVTIQAVVDLSGMDTKNLVFYSYADNKPTKLAVASYGVDKNGFLSFPTTVGGVIVVSDGALTK